MMRLELGLEKPSLRRPLVSALTIGGAYILGGAMPLTPYFFAPTASVGLTYSAVLTAIALLIFGAVKGRFTGVPLVRGALQTLLVGALAAAVAFLIGRAV